MARPKLRPRTYVASARVALRLSRLVRTSFPSGFRLSYCRRYRAHLLTNFADLRQLLCHRGRGDTLRLGVPERVSFPCVRWRRPRVSSRRHDGGRFLFPDTRHIIITNHNIHQSNRVFDAHIKRLSVCLYGLLGCPLRSRPPVPFVQPHHQQRQKARHSSRTKSNLNKHLPCHHQHDDRCFCGGAEDDYTEYGDELDASDCDMQCSGESASHAGATV